MSEDCSPKRLPCRVHSTFDLAVPLTELPPDRDVVIQSPETIRRKLTAVNDILANAKCEEGTSMDSIATYIPPKVLRERMAEQEARLHAIAVADATAKAQKKAARIRELEAKLEALRRGSGGDDADEQLNLEKMTIARPASVAAHTVPLKGEEAVGGTIVDGTQSSPVSAQKVVSPTARASLTSGSGVFVAPPAIGALVAAPPAMGALMAAPPAIGALVVAALQPAAQSPTSDQQEAGPFTEDFKLIHNEYKDALAMEKAKKNR